MRPDSPTPEVACSILVVPTDDAEREGDDDEGEPAEDGRLAVMRAPAPHSAGEVGRPPRLVGRGYRRAGLRRLVGLVLDDRGLHRSSSLEAVVRFDHVVTAFGRAGDGGLRPSQERPPALDQHGCRREAHERGRADRGRMNGEESGEADEQGQRPAGPGAPEGHGRRDHGDHPAQQPGDERDRQRVAEDVVLVVVLDGVRRRPPARRPAGRSRSRRGRPSRARPSPRRRYRRRERRRGRPGSRSPRGSAGPWRSRNTASAIRGVNRRNAVWTKIHPPTSWRMPS